MVEASWGDTARDSMTAKEKFRRLEIEAMNEEARIANVLAMSRPGISEEDYWNVPPRTEAKRYADTYGGEVVNTADRLRLSSGNPGEPLPEITDPRITRTRLLADEYNALKVAQASRNGEDLAPTLNNAARLGLYDTSGDGMPIKATPEENPISNLASRFGSGLVHGAIDMVWQPVAQTIDLGQAAIGFVSGGRYEPTWLSGIGRNYDAGMSYGETMTRAVLGSNPVTGVGMASYDLTSSAMQGDWGGVAEGAGGLVGGFAAGKYGQRWMAPEPGAQLGVYRVRPQVEITNPLVDPGGLLPPLPKWEAPNFISAEPVYLGRRTLNRVFDNVKAYDNGAYWGEKTYSSEGAWRSGVAVPEGQNWNKGTLQGEWQPHGGWGWRGRAAPQSVPGYSTQKWGFTAGWIQRGGDYQISVPNSRNTIPAGAVTSEPAPWKKP